MILSVVLALAIFAGTAFCVVLGLDTVRTSKRLVPKVAFGVLMAVALAVGMRFGVVAELQLNDGIQVHGVPIPLVVFALEGQNWVDFVKPAFVTCLCAAADALFPVGVVGLLWTLFSKCRRQRP
jgi:hypothetical protein